MEPRIDRGQMKREARASMGGRNPSVYLVTLAFLLMNWVLSGLTLRLQWPDMDLMELMNGNAVDAAYYYALLEGRASFFGQILTLAVEVMEIMISVGFTAYCLNVARNLSEAGFGDLFDAFGNFLKVLGLSVLIGIFVFFWSLLLVIPGIIAYYRYSMAIYILLDDPDKPIMTCIQESKEMTRGHKGELFLLDLSFLGWYLLSVIPFVSLYTSPYTSITRANYYRALSGKYDQPLHVDFSF